MNNIKKGFKQKSALRCADGGFIYAGTGASGERSFTDRPGMPGAGQLYGQVMSNDTIERVVPAAPRIVPAPVPAAPSLSVQRPAAPISPRGISGAVGSALSGARSAYEKARDMTTSQPQNSGSIGSRPTVPAQPVPKAGIDYLSRTGGPSGTLRQTQRTGAMGYPLMTTTGYANGGMVYKQIGAYGEPVFTDKAPPAPMPPAVKKLPKKMKADGGKITGPGGPTDDKIPAMLSNGEYVLPADTVAAVGVKTLDALKNATHTKGKSSLRNGVVYAAGGFSAEELRRAALEAQHRVQNGLPAPGDSWGRQPATTVRAPVANPTVTPSPILDKSFSTPGMQRPVVAANAPTGYSPPKQLPQGVQYTRGAIPPGAPEIPRSTAAERVINNNLIAQQNAGIPKRTPEVTLGQSAKAAQGAAAQGAAAQGAAAQGAAAQAASKPGLLARATSAIRSAPAKVAALPGSAAKYAAKLYTPAVAGYSALQSLGDDAQGYTDYRDGGTGGHVGRTLEAVGNGLLFDLPERAIQGAISLAEGDGFGAGWNLPTRREEFYAQRRDPITGALPATQPPAQNTPTQAAPPAEQQQPPSAATSTSDIKTNNQGSYSNVVDANGNPVYAPNPSGGEPIGALRRDLINNTPEWGQGPTSALRRPQQPGLNMPNQISMALREANKRFDKIAADLRNQPFTSAAKRARTLAGIEQARTQAMGEILGNETARRGQDVQQGMNDADIAAARELETMRGEYGLAASALRPGRAVDPTKTELAYSKEDRANFEAMYGAEAAGPVMQAWAANRQHLPDGAAGIQEAGRLYKILQAAGLPAGTTITSFGVNPETGGKGSEETDVGQRIDRAKGIMGKIGAGLNFADYLGDDNYYSFTTDAGPVWVPRRKLDDEAFFQNMQTRAGLNNKE